MISEMFKCLSLLAKAREFLRESVGLTLVFSFEKVSADPVPVGHEPAWNVSREPLRASLLIGCLHPTCYQAGLPKRLSPSCSFDHLGQEEFDR